MGRLIPLGTYNEKDRVSKDYYPHIIGSSRRNNGGLDDLIPYLPWILMWL